MVTPDASTLAALGLGAVAVSQLYAIARSRLRIRRAWNEVRAARALDRIDTLALAPLVAGGNAIDSVLPTLATFGGAVTAVLPLALPGARSRLRVAWPSEASDTAVRSLGALLAALSLSADEAPEVAQAVRTQLPQKGRDVTVLLRRGGSSLPSPAREKLLAKVPRAPFVVIPAVREAQVIAVLIAVVLQDDVDALAQKLARVAARLALFFPMPVPERVRRPPRPATPRRVAPHGAEIVLWMDPSGAVAAYELLQSDWKLDTPPASLRELLRGDELGAMALMRRAHADGETDPCTVLLADGTEAQLSLVAMSDGDQGIWGFAALVRRLKRDEVATVEAQRSAR